MSVTLECKRCEKPFTVRPSRADSAKFCSKECANRRHIDKGKSGQVELTCEECGDSFTVPRSRADVATYCSEQCMSEGYREYSKIQLECEFCGSEFEVKENRKGTAKYCSKSCQYGHIKLFGEPVLKKCRKCGVELAIQDFPNHGPRLCPSCYKEHERERYQKKRERYQKEGYDVPDEKECGGCGRVLPIDDFAINRGSKDKHNPQCKKCQAEYHKQYHVENRDEILQRQREWQEENDPSNKWAIERRERENDVAGSYTLDDVYRQWHKQNGQCFWCGERCGKKPSHHNYEVDHLTPLSKKDSDPVDWPRNLVVACKSCNRSKKNKLPIEFKRYRLKHKSADSTYLYGSTIGLSSEAH